MIIVNKAECLKCGDKPFSTHRHHFAQCSCGNIAVDGGQEYFRRVGSGISDQSWKDLSFELPDEVVEACKEALKWGDETGRNDLGKVLAIFRALNDHKRLVTTPDVDAS